MHLSCLDSSCLVLSCVSLVACFVFLCCVVSCVWRSLSLCCLLSVVCVVLCCVLCVSLCVRVCFRRRIPQKQQENIFEAAAPATPSVWLVCLFGFAWACVGLCVLGGGEGVYASNASPCVRSKRFRVYGIKPTCFIYVGLVPVRTRTF